MAETVVEENTAEAQAEPTQTSDGPPEEQLGAADRPAPAADTEARPPGRETAGAPEETSPGEASDTPPPAASSHSMEFLSEIEVLATAELGSSQLTIGEVLALTPGSVVQLDKMLGDPVELMVKDSLIARGEVVVVDDRFGVRVTEIASRAAREEPA